MHDPQLETHYPSPTSPASLHIAPTPASLNLRETGGYSVPELAHDARNLVSALELYCELLGSPGVLAPGNEHYAEDLRRVAGSGARLIEALADPRLRNASPGRGQSLVTERGNAPRRGIPAARPPCIEDLPAELAALEATLRALAGPGVKLEIECAPCAGRLALSSEELLRILFNLLANALEAIVSTPAELRRRPFVRITAQRGGGASFLDDRGAPEPSQTVVLSVRDNGPGIAPRHLEHIFDAGFSTRTRGDGGDSRGLGLAIVRQLAAAAGGAVRAVSPTGLGVRFDIELPLLPPEAGGDKTRTWRTAADPGYFEEDSRFATNLCTISERGVGCFQQP